MTLMVQKILIDNGQSIRYNDTKWLSVISSARVAVAESLTTVMPALTEY